MKNQYMLSAIIMIRLRILHPAVFREETMPDYFVAYKNAIKAAGTNERIINHLYYILAKFVVKEYIMKMLVRR